MRCPSGAVWSRIVVTAGRKPRSAMWSASSITETSTPDSTRQRRSSRSINRPGVATTRSTPRFNASICLPYGAPPNTQQSFRPSASPSGRSASATCMASSRVGTSTRARGAFDIRIEPDVARRASIGRPKAIVLPPPVWARPSTSRPANASGIACDWIANGFSMPRLLSAITSAFGRPSSAKRAIGSRLAIARSSNRSSSETAATLGARDWVDLLAPRFGRRVGAPLRVATAPRMGRHCAQVRHWTTGRAHRRCAWAWTSSKGQT